MYRMAKLVPWYHQNKPQCVAETLRDKQQCINSATFEGYGKGKGAGVKLCKIHAQMADFPVRPIQARSVLLRDDR